MPYRIGYSNRNVSESNRIGPGRAFRRRLSQIFPLKLWTDGGQIFVESAHLCHRCPGKAQLGSLER